MPNHNLSSVLAFKSLLALCQVDAKTNKLRAIYHASCLVAGRDPLWGIWSVPNGRFVRYCRSKQDVLDAYPQFAVRRTMAKWRNPDDDARHSNVAARRNDLKTEFKGLPKLRVVK